MQRACRRAAGTACGWSAVQLRSSGPTTSPKPWGVPVMLYVGLVVVSVPVGIILKEGVSCVLGAWAVSAAAACPCPASGRRFRRWQLGSDSTARCGVKRLCSMRLPRSCRELLGFD